MAHLPGVVFEDRGGAEEGDGRALAGGGEVHGGGVHSNKKCGAAEEPGELGPIGGAGRGLNPRSVFFAKRACGFDLAGIGAAADEEPRNEVE